MKKHFPFLLAIFLFSLFGMKALLHSGLFTAHDIWHQVARLYHYYQGLTDGQIPPYWIATLANGFGYPLFFFSYHLPWILGAPFLLSGIDIPTTLKILFLSSYLFSGIFMYLFAFDLFQNRFAALVSALLYQWAPYHFLTILVSAAMGVSFVFTFAPLILWGIYKTSRHKSWLGIVFIGIGFSGSILSHLMTTISLIPLIGLFTLWVLSEKSTKVGIAFLKKTLYGILLGIGLSAFYLIPAIHYSQFTQVATGVFASLYQKHFVNLTQLIYSKWGYGLADTAKEMQISFQIGIAQWFAVVISALLIVFWKNLQNQKFLHITLIASFLLSIIAMIDLSRPLWDLISQFVTLDYPTIFLLPAVLSGSLLAGFVVAYTKQFHILIAFFFIAIALYTNRNHLAVNMYTNIPVSLYVASEITTNSYHEYLPSTADVKLFDEPLTSIVLPNTIIPTDITKNTKELSFSISVPHKTEITINHFSFAGIKLYVDNLLQAFKTDDRGRMVFNSEQGEHRVSVRFEETPLIKIAKFITIVSLLYLFLLLTKIHAKTT